MYLVVVLLLTFQCYLYFTSSSSCEGSLLFLWYFSDFTIFFCCLYSPFFICWFSSISSTIYLYIVSLSEYIKPLCYVSIALSCILHYYPQSCCCCCCWCCTPLGTITVDKADIMINSSIWLSLFIIIGISKTPRFI